MMFLEQKMYNTYRLYIFHSKIKSLFVYNNSDLWYVYDSKFAFYTYPIFQIEKGILKVTVPQCMSLTYISFK